MYLWILVVAQFALAGFLVLSARWTPLPVIELVFALPGVALAVWAWLRVGISKIRIHPTATESTQLVTDGPYGFVRHPMYTGLLWFTAVLLFEPFQWWRVVAWIGLLLVLSAKASCEERSMLEIFPTYRGYQSRVGRLIPMLRRWGV